MPISAPCPVHDLGHGPQPDESSRSRRLGGGDADASATRRPTEAGGDLRVERLGRGHAHLHVTTVGGVQHAVGTIGEVTVPSVDDRDHRRSTRPHEVDRAIGVGRRAALAHGDHHRVGHVISELEPGELRGQHALGAHVGARGERAHRLDESPTGDGCGALTDHQQAGDRPVGDAARTTGGTTSSPRWTPRPSGPSSSLPRRVLRNDPAASPISFRR